MIDLQKLIAECDFHLKRGDNMVMDPQDVKDLAFAAKPAPDVQELINVLSMLSRWVDQNCEDPACTLPLKLATETLAKHGVSNG